jgi:hypothetical protein
MAGPGFVATATTPTVLVMHPTTTAFTESVPTTFGVLFDGFPPVLAGDPTMVHTVVAGKHIGPCIGYAVPSQAFIRIDGRPIIKTADIYQCQCGGQCLVYESAAPFITIGE